MARRSTASKPKGIITVDFEGVTSGGAGLPDEGDHTVEVTAVTVEEGDQAQYLKWELTVRDEGKNKGRKAWTNTSLAPQALWRLRGLLEALEYEVPDGPMDIDVKELVGSEVGVTISHREWERDGKKGTSADVTDFFNLETGEVAEKEEPKDKGKADGKLAKVKASEVMEMSAEDLEGIVEKYKLKIDLDEHRTLRKKANAVNDALESADMLDDE